MRLVQKPLADMNINDGYHLADNYGSRSRNRGIYIAVSLKTKFKRHMPGEFHDCLWVFWSRHCSRKCARRVEERRRIIRRKRR